MSFYSQFGQDQFLYENFFRDKFDGFYIDIGAYDGITGSNTYFFEDIGWRGICIEPNPDVYKILNSNRKSINLECGIYTYEGISSFCKLDGYTEQLSGIIDEYCEKHVIRINKENLEHGCQKKVIDINVITFSKLMESYNISHVDYCSIDTEGSEFNILKSIDFSKFYIKVFSIENNYDDKSIREFMNNNNYMLVKTFGNIDELYIKND